MRETHGPWDGPSEVGSGAVHEEAVPLSQLIDIVNERFGTDFNQADQLFFDQIVEAAVADEALGQAAAANPKEKFELVFGTLLERLMAERIDQNEEIFIRFVNDAAFQRLVGSWMATEAYRRLRERQAGAGERPSGAPPQGLRLVEGRHADRYVTCLPLVPLKAAAGAFGDPQHVEDGEFEWVGVQSGRRLTEGMFVAQVVGKSMEPTIPDGAYCLFRAPVAGTRQGKTVLVQLRDPVDPETGERYTVKRYRSEKAAVGEDSWRHERIKLEPSNSDFAPIILEDVDEGDVQVIAEFVEVVA